MAKFCLCARWTAPRNGVMPLDVPRLATRQTARRTPGVVIWPAGYSPRCGSSADTLQCALAPRGALITISQNFRKKLLLGRLDRLIAIKFDKIILWILPEILHCRNHISFKPIKSSLNFFLISIIHAPPSYHSSL